MNQAKNESGADRCTTVRVVKREGDAAGFLYGALVFYPARNGWKFVSNIAHRKGSRKHYPTPEAAFPSWLKRSEVVFERTYIVGTRDPHELTVRSNEPRCEIPAVSSSSEQQP